MRKLYRSSRNRRIFGLCGGLAETLNVDATLLRLVLVVTAFFSGGTVVPLYVLASLVIPREPFDSPPGFGPFQQEPPYRSWSPYRRGGARGFAAGPQPAYTHGPQQPQANQPGADHLDDLMKDIEKKAMTREIEELRAKLANYEKGER